MSKLVIVESPSKCKTIEKYLGSNYKVLSSKGHIRDLATTGKYGFGVDIDNKFAPNYTVVKGKKKVIDELKKEAKNSDEVILATDPDREGEAISWHLFDAMGLKEDDYSRVFFNEITEKAINEAFKHPKKIDDNLVHSQETRRILDRIIGFRLSKLMQKKTGGKSAGRVQSVALKLIVDREREIEVFNPEQYFTIEAYFKDFEAYLEKYKGKKIEIKSEVEKNEILDTLSNAFTLDKIEEKEKAKNSPLPFYTSTLTQAASNRLGFSASKTMKIAQKLYEGIELDDGYTGLITYMRSDSARLSDAFITETKDYISKNYGKEYIGFVKKSKNKDNVQDAHEAIRPTDINKHPDKIKKYLSPDEYKLYKFIYYRALASLMAPAKINATAVTLLNGDYEFKTTGSVYTFLGYLEIYKDYSDIENKVLPDFNSYKSNVIVSNKIEGTEHFTEPPARFTEASLIKELEHLGIGRPSTYTKIIDVLKLRKYIEILNKRFVPTEVAIKTTDRLQEYFKDLINVKYTAQMEKDLDDVALGDIVWYELLDSFYKKFDPLVNDANDNMEKEAPKTTGEMCPKCGKELIIRNGKFGLFTACSGYPECKYIKKDEVKVVEVCDCNLCDGKIVEKKTRKGKIFYGCNNYPKCKNAFWDKPTGEKCPKCNNLLVEKKDKNICPTCDKK